MRTDRHGAALAVLLGLATAAGTASAQPAQRVFDTPEAAAQALVETIERRDRPGVEEIVGPDFAELIDDQGTEANAEDRTSFLEAAKETVTIRPDGDDRALMLVGYDAWPLPAPLVRDASGWHFDGAAGVEAVQDRLVGRNELQAIATLEAYVLAQETYSAEDRDGDQVLEYAQRLQSTPGTHDGLYWPVETGDDPSPLGPFVAAAGMHPESREQGIPYYGYHFRIMTRQGDNVPGGAYDYVINGNMIAGFAMVAWPATHGESGVMTFVVNQSGVVLEKDMGPDTGRIGPRMLTYNPDGGWTPVDD
jgi:hypothetical protein